MSDFDRHSFWRDPAHYEGAPKIYQQSCAPEFYLDLVNITRLVVSTLERFAEKDWSILEIGCGTGRNLVGLQKAGFTNLSGVEINPAAVALGREHFPEYRAIDVLVSPIEEVINDLPDYDVIYTQGVLMHLPYELAWVIATIAQKAREVVLINEGERGRVYHVWDHKFRDIFERNGWQQVEEETGDKYPPLPATTIKRVFLRA